MKILVIEDDPTSQRLAHAVLAEGGGRVRSIDTAEKAPGAIADDAPEVILLDLALPGADGLQLARRLKADPSTRDIPIVAVTAYPSLWSREEAVGAGCDAYIVKPLDTRTLVGTLKEIVSK